MATLWQYLRRTFGGTFRKRVLGNCRSRITRNLEISFRTLSRHTRPGSALIVTFVVEDVLPVDSSHHNVVNSALTSLPCLSCHVSSRFRIFPIIPDDSKGSKKNVPLLPQGGGVKYSEEINEPRSTRIGVSFLRDISKGKGMVPEILAILDFRSNNDVHRPVIHALNLIKRYNTTGYKVPVFSHFRTCPNRRGNTAVMEGAHR